MALLSITRRPSYRELLLDVLEVLAARPASADEIVVQLQRNIGDPAFAHRIRQALEALEAETLIKRRTHPAERATYQATGAGLGALESRGRAAPRSAAVAVLFTDLVESTSLIERFGEEIAHELRRRHFGLLRGAIANHRGTEVKCLGDGLMVVFAGPGEAIACAEAMQCAVGDDGDRLQLRVGIHAGQAIREGDDFFGTPVIVARRLCDAARAGEILVSAQVRGAVAERNFELLGDLSFKGLREPIAASILRCATSGYAAPAVSAPAISTRSLPIPSAVTVS
jgi:class 3 adenylate cyclase